jgi:hypothetical protein
MSPENMAQPGFAYNMPSATNNHWNPPRRCDLTSPAQFKEVHLTNPNIAFSLNRTAAADLLATCIQFPGETRKAHHEPVDGRQAYHDILKHEFHD